MKSKPSNTTKCKSCGRRFKRGSGELREVNTNAGQRLWCSLCRQETVKFPFGRLLGVGVKL